MNPQTKRANLDNLSLAAARQCENHFPKSFSFEFLPPLFIMAKGHLLPLWSIGLKDNSLSHGKRIYLDASTRGGF